SDGVGCGLQRRMSCTPPSPYDACGAIYNSRRAMNILLMRPDPGNERFGLGPFFRVEPLGLEYIGAALAERGHTPSVVDLRFRGSVRAAIRAARPRLVGLSCMHAHGYDPVLEAPREPRPGGRPVVNRRRPP